MRTSYKYTALYRRFTLFCQANKINPEDLLYGCCEGRLSNFPRWYVDYINYTRAEIRNRVKTGVVKKIDYKDIWS